MKYVPTKQKKIKGEKNVLIFLMSFGITSPVKFPLLKWARLYNHEVVEERFRWGRLEAQLISGNSLAFVHVPLEAIVGLC